MLKIIRNKSNVMETLTSINRTIDELTKENITTLNFRNFVSEYLTKLFNAADIRMPDITYNIEFTGPYQTIRVSSCGLSWTVMNNNNIFLYCPSLDIFVKEPIAVVLPIFIDMITMLGYNDNGNIEIMIQEKK
jgi:hypothetical protein